MIGKNSASTKGKRIAAYLADLPITINIGTVAAASRKDVLAYARGIAETQLIAKDESFIDAFAHNGQWIYEIHEGGAAVALAPWVVQQLDQNARGSAISLPLAGQRIAQITTFEGEITTIIFPPDEQRYAASFQDIESKAADHPCKSLKSLFDDGSRIRQAGRNAALAGLLAFFASSGTFFVRMNWTDVSAALAQKTVDHDSFVTPVLNLPSVQLKKAMAAMTASNSYLSYLKFDGGKWVHAQATSAAVAPAQQSTNR